MDRDYRKERQYVVSRADEFLRYLHREVLTEKAIQLLKVVARQTDVYIFSGIIRNFLLGFTENRDVDVVVAEVDNLSLPHSLLRGCKIEENSFGGYKLLIDNISIDAWPIASTWGLLHEGLKPKPYSLIRTAFFNFSSIAFSYNDKRFIFDGNLCSFLRSNIMDVVYPFNPNPALCILNTAYYARKYKFPISFKLSKWLIRYYNEKLPFVETQERHFHKQIVSNETLAWMMKIVEDALNVYKMKKGQGLSLDFVQRQYDIIDESSATEEEF